MTKKEKKTLYDRVKIRVLNNKFAVGLIVLGVTISFLASMKESVIKLLPGENSASELTLVTTVLDERMYCGGVPVEEGEEVMIQKATLDIAINNPSSRAHIVTALALEPVELEANFWAGELKVGAVYELLLDDWWKELFQTELAALERDEPWARPSLDTMTVREIVDNKFTIKAQSEERFQVKLGLTRSIDFLYGSIRVIVETDGGANLRSGLLWIVVCHPEFKMPSN